MHSEILSGLWISSYKSLCNKRFVYDKNISFIINLTDNDIDDKYMNVANSPRIDIINIPINDAQDSKYNNIYLLDNMTDILSKINTKLVNHNVLISCYSGFHASVAVACCYLIKYGNVNLEYAYNSIISKNSKLNDIKTKYMSCISNFIILLKKNNV